MATMLREEPELLYMYEYIKVDRSKKEDLSHVIPEEWNIGDMIYTTTPLMDKQYYKFVATYRRAFVGDMQKRLDVIMKRDNMLAFCRSKENNNTRVEYKEKIVYIHVERPSLFKKIISYIFKGRVGDELFLEKKLEKEHVSFMDKGELSHLEEYLSKAKEL